MKMLFVVQIFLSLISLQWSIQWLSLPHADASPGEEFRLTREFGSKTEHFENRKRFDITANSTFDTFRVIHVEETTYLSDDNWDNEPKGTYNKTIYNYLIPLSEIEKIELKALSTVDQLVAGDNDAIGKMSFVMKAGIRPWLDYDVWTQAPGRTLKHSYHTSKRAEFSVNPHFPYANIQPDSEIVESILKPLVDRGFVIDGAPDHQRTADLHPQFLIHYDPIQLKASTGEGVNLKFFMINPSHTKKSETVKLRMILGGDAVEFKIPSLEPDQLIHVETPIEDSILEKLVQTEGKIGLILTNAAGVEFDVSDMFQENGVKGTGSGLETFGKWLIATYFYQRVNRESTPEELSISQLIRAMDRIFSKEIFFARDQYLYGSDGVKRNLIEEQKKNPHGDTQLFMMLHTLFMRERQTPESFPSWKLLGKRLRQYIPLLKGSFFHNSLQGDFKDLVSDFNR